jgi:O-antigen/teichoic acid export membrane protein
MPAVEQDHSARRGKRFIVNLLWNWIGVGATLISGLLISPYLIRKLGPEGYGVWVLSFALVDNYAFLDLGFRSATVKYVAHYWATGEPVRINEILNTVIAYAGTVSLALFAAILVGSSYVDRLFKVSPAYAHSFRTLVMLVSLSWCLGFVFNIFAASLEAVQRFDLYNKATVAMTMFRVVGTAILLYLGRGLVEIGVIVIVSQALGYALYFLVFRHVFPELRFSTRYASLATLKKMGSFGIHTFVLNVANLILTQSPLLLIGHFLPASFAGYFSAPNRLLQYSGEAVGRAGVITNANAAELKAREDTSTLPQLAIFTNRYCLVLFMPIAISLWVFGDALFALWVPSIARFSAPLLRVMLVGYVIAVAGQFSSSMLLQGLGRHQRYARGVMTEAILCVAILVWIIPRYGTMGAAWVISILMILNRGLFTPWLVSREMSLSFPRFVASIYVWPFLSAVPAFAIATSLKFSVLPGHTWAQLGALIAIIGISYLGVAVFLCVPPNHRVLLRLWLGQKVPWLRMA